MVSPRLRTSKRNIWNTIASQATKRAAREKEERSSLLPSGGTWQWFADLHKPTRSLQPPGVSTGKSGVGSSEQKLWATELGKYWHPPSLGHFLERRGQEHGTRVEELHLLQLLKRGNVKKQNWVRRVKKYIGECRLFYLDTRPPPPPKYQQDIFEMTLNKKASGSR